MTFIFLTKTLALLRVSASEESRASPVDASAAITYMFFPADAAVVNLRRKEAILRGKGRKGYRASGKLRC